MDVKYRIMHIAIRKWGKISNAWENISDSADIGDNFAWFLRYFGLNKADIEMNIADINNGSMALAVNVTKIHNAQDDSW